MAIDILEFLLRAFALIFGGIMVAAVVGVIIYYFWWLLLPLAIFSVGVKLLEIAIG